MITVYTFFTMFCCHHFPGCKLGNNFNKLYKIIIFKDFAVTFLSDIKIATDFKNYATVYNVYISKTHFDLTGDFLYEYFVTSGKLRIVTALFIYVINMTKCLSLVFCRRTVHSDICKVHSSKNAILLI